MRRRPPGAKRPDTLFPYTTLVRSHAAHQLNGLRRGTCPANARGDHGMITSNDNNGGEERRTIWIVLLLNAAIAAGFCVSGFFADSSALIAKRVDTLSDTAVYALSLVSLTRGQTRSEERSVGTECGMTGKLRGAGEH